MYSTCSGCRVRHVPAARPAPLRSAVSQQQRQARRSAALHVRAQAAGQGTQDIEALNKHFGIPGRVEVVAGHGGLPTVRLQHACGSSAEVTLFGACITSWKQASGDEVLYMR